MKTIAELEEFMTKPSPELIEDMKKLDGDLMILGVSGKMGPTIAKMAKRAVDQAGIKKRIIGVARFSDENLRQDLENFGIEIRSANLLNDEELQALPNVKNILFMVGTKFGTLGNEHRTWAINAYLPGRVAEKFKDSRIVVFSTGNVYPFTPVSYNGCSEDVKPNPIGEYAQSCLGRERIFTYFSLKNHTPVLIYRLNYAIDLRYGVLLEIAQSVYQGKPIDLTTGSVNVIWQGDASEYALRSLLHTSTPPNILNVTGPETLSVRWLAKEFGKRFRKEPIFENSESPTALLNNASKAHQLFGYPKVTVLEMIDLISEWILSDGPTINKPTHFQEREGVF
jgi:hypothetical protein